MSNCFDDLVPAPDFAARDEWIADKETSFEQKAVKTVMTQLGLANEIVSVKQAITEWNGDDAKLSFPWFHQRFPTFPVKLCTKNYVKAHEVTVINLFKRFTKTKIYEAYLDMKDGEPSECLGLICPWNGLGLVIIHDYPIHINGTRIVRNFPNGQIVYLDILSSFLEEITKRWSP